MASPEFEKAISLLAENFKKYSSHSSWADNLIIASKHLKTKQDWGLFYHYIASPRTFDYEKALELVKKEECVDEQAPIELDDRFTYECIRNGTSDECVIRVKLKEKAEPDQEDEKSPL